MKYIAERQSNTGNYGGWYTESMHNQFNIGSACISELWDVHFFDTLEEAVETISKACDDYRKRLSSGTFGIHSGKSWNYANKNAWKFYSANEKAWTLVNKMKCKDMSDGFMAWKERNDAWQKEAEITEINIPKQKAPKEVKVFSKPNILELISAEQIQELKKRDHTRRKWYRAMQDAKTTWNALNKIPDQDFYELLYYLKPKAGHVPSQLKSPASEYARDILYAMSDKQRAVAYTIITKRYNAN